MKARATVTYEILSPSAFSQYTELGHFSNALISIRWLYELAVAICPCVLLFPDVNECTSSENNCDRNANCVNTAGSFTCTCKRGFVGNGVTCTPGKSIVTLV